MKPFLFRNMWANIRILDATNGDEVRFDIGALKSRDGYQLTAFQNMTVLENLSGGNKIAVTLTPPSYQDFLRLINSPFLRLGNTLSVRWGYTDSADQDSDWHHSFMQQPNVQFDVESFSVTLNGDGFATYLGHSSTKKVWASEAKPRSVHSIALELLKKHGLKLVIESKAADNSVEAEAELGKAGKYLTTDRDDIVQSGENDIVFLRKLFTSVGFYVWISKGIEFRVFWGVRPPEVTRVFQVYTPQVLDPGGIIFPMWGYSAEQHPYWSPPGVVYDAMGADSKRDDRLEVIDRDTSPDDKGPKSMGRGYASERSAIVGQVSGDVVLSGQPGDVKADPETGAKVASDETGGNRAPRFIMAPRSQRDLLPLRAQGIADKAIGDLGVAVEFESLDDPTLRPEQLVETRGIGQFFSSKHNVLEVEHRIGLEFGTMRVKCGRLGSGQSGQVPDLMGDAGNPQKPQAQEDGKATTEPNTDAGA